MARLFLTNKDQQFMSHVTSEVIKDVNGQFIVYYPVSMKQTKVHPIYDEAIEKIFENPIKVDALIGQPERAVVFNSFGSEQTTNLEVFIQSKDIINKNIDIFDGDFFVYGASVYEVLTAVDINNIYGQEDYSNGVKLTAKLARMGQFDIETFKSLIEQSRNFVDSDVQKTFVQQRGLPETEEGATNDKRDMLERLKGDMAPIALGEGPRKVAEIKTDDLENPRDEATDAETSGFYHE